ncbi:hypothetical protein J7J63_07975, partial [Candidatus Bipolaricaulota bacterium]|nr:hypothetical protein [Candidatus Bipolaricaulota bacterium]
MRNVTNGERGARNDEERGTQNSERGTEKRSHAKNAKDAKEGNHEDKKGSRAVLGDLGVLERATASGREKKTRNAELGMRNGEANSRKGLLRALRVLRGASHWNAKPRMNVEWGRMWNAEGGTRNAERDERGT